MKKITLFTVAIAIVMVIGSCSVFQKNGKSKEKPATEQSQDIDEESNVDTDW